MMDAFTAAFREYFSSLKNKLRKKFMLKAFIPTFRFSLAAPFRGYFADTVH